MLVFETNAIKNLRDIFPNLRVIGGQSLIQHFSLIIYRNQDLEILGLDKLAVIRNGGVRIQDNKVLCHPNTIDWKSMILGPINDVLVDDAADMAVSETGKLCQKGCEDDSHSARCRYHEVQGVSLQSCWNDTTCDKICAYERDPKTGIMGPGCDPDGNKCHDQCIGGCDKPNDAAFCSACKHFHHNGKCVPACADHLYRLMDRRCVTKNECLALNPYHKNVSVPIKATDGLCSDRCPTGFEIDKKNPHKCKKCDGVCIITCNIDHVIDSFPKALALKHCNIIEGNLTIEMRGKQDTGMAAQLKEVFSNIQVITGYLSIQRSTPFLSLGMFKSLRRIEARSLFQDQYALVVVENHNLRKLFESNTNFTIGRGTVQFHNNRMLCFNLVERLMEMLHVKHNPIDQTPLSNGDKAICQDLVIVVNVTQTTAYSMEFEWPGFNTTNMDHRKFLGYELYWKSVDYVDPTMSIDDDRSACVDSWSSKFIQHIERDDMKIAERIAASVGATNGILPDTIYAYYVATQMVHHAGAKNGISKIGFTRTAFAVPDPPILGQISSFTDGITIHWDVPRIPNGQITHYEVTWRALPDKMDVIAEKFAIGGKRNQEDININTYLGDYEVIRLPEEQTSTTLVSTLAPFTTTSQTCSAIPNCCECSAAKPVGSAFTENPDHASAMEQANFENQLMDATIMQRDQIRARRSIENANRVNEMLEREEKEAPTPAPKKKLIYVNAKKSTTSPQPTPVTTTPTSIIRTTQEMPTTTTEPRKHNVIYDLTPNATDVPHRYGINLTALPDGNRYTIAELQHFTLYGLSVSACQNDYAKEHHCSPVHRAGARRRTLPKQGIDMIDNSTIRVYPGKNHRALLIKWSPPNVNDTNGGIRGYEIQLKNLMNNVEPAAKFIGAVANWSSEENGTMIENLSHGKYRIYITATSLHGVGDAVYADLEGARIIEPGFFTLPVIATILFVILFIIGGIALTVYYYVQIHYGKKVKALADFMHLNPEYCTENKYVPDDWELDPTSVVMLAQIGEGSFGKVFKGEGKNIKSLYGVTFGPCAIKSNISDEPDAGDNSMNYLMEANIMKNFKTSHIVKLYGVISTYDPAWVVMEMMDMGNLRDYLRSKREDEVFNEMDCNFFDIVPREKFSEWASMISDGMAYLESLKFCHRDLAARNCMIDAHEIVKIGDFGMARDLFYHDYYKPSGKRMMPVRWMSPESLKDGKFDSKSDVWSFGVVIYEMVTLGAQPYIGLSNDEVLNYIGMSRKVIRKPDCCSDYWYKIMKMCWRYSPRDRPTFLQLVHLLSADASEAFKERSFVFTENQMAMEDSEPLDLDGIDIWDDPDPDVKPAESKDESDATSTDPEDPKARRNTDSIPMKQFKTAMPNSPSTLSVDGATKRGRDDEYQLMTHSRGPSDTEVRHYGGDGDYVERDVQNDGPTRRNTGASTSSYTGGPYCLANRGGSNERAGFGEGLRLTDNIGSGHLNDDNDYVEKDLSSMDTRRSTGASTASYGVPQPTNWSGTRGATYYANKHQQQQQAAAAAAAAQQALLNGGRGDRLTQLPGTGSIKNGRDEDYIETMPRNNGRNQGSPSRNGNTGPNRGSFNGRSAFGENERLIEDTEHPLS